jgi:hypothetical protein
LPVSETEALTPTADEFSRLSYLDLQGTSPFYGRRTVYTRTLGVYSQRALGSQGLAGRSCRYPGGRYAGFGWRSRDRRPLRGKRRACRREGKVDRGRADARWREDHQNSDDSSGRVVAPQIGRALPR